MFFWYLQKSDSWSLSHSKCQHSLFQLTFYEKKMIKTNTHMGFDPDNEKPKPMILFMFRYVATDLATDMIIRVGDIKFYLHKVQ